MSGRKQQTTSWAAVNYLMRSGHSWSGLEQNNVYVNLGDGTYADISYLSGVGFVDDARGAAPVDWDGDGDLDLWINNRSAPKVRFMRNEYDGGSQWLAIRLVGRSATRDAIGARVEARLTNGRTLLRTVRAGVNYTVQGTKWVHFGLGPEGVLDEIVVRWPNGEAVSYDGLIPGARYVIDEEDPSPRRLPDLPRAHLRASAFEAAPESQVASVPLGAPLPLPELSLVDFDGVRHPFKSDRPTLVNLWASWCGGCRREFAGFAEHRSVLDASGVRILAASVDKPEDRQAAVDTVRQYGLWFPAGMADPSLLPLIESIKKVVFDRYDDLPLPSSLLIDRDGRLARIYLGPCEAEQLARDVERLERLSGDVDTLYAASPYPGGRWLHPELWVTSEKGSQLVKMTQFLHQDGHTNLAVAYAGVLSDYVAEVRPPAAAARKAAIAVANAASEIVATDAREAVRLCRNALAASPENVQARIALTAGLLEMGDAGSRAEAAAVFADVRPDMRAPQTAHDHAIYGTTLYRIGETEEALPYLERALKDAPNENAFVRMCYGSALVDAGRLAEGIESLERSIEGLPPNAALERRLATALDRAGRPDEALVHHRRVLELLPAPSNPEEHVLAGQSHFRLGAWDAAVTHLAPVVAADPGRTAERGMLGLALARLGRDEESLAHLEVAMPLLPPDADSEYVFGILLARTGNLERAVTSFEKVVEMDPGATQAVRSLALALDRLGRTDEAIGRFRAYLASTPGDAMTRQRLADAYERAGRAAEAAAEYRALIDVSPEIRFRLAWILAACPADAVRDGDEALRLAEEVAAAVGRDHPAVLDLLAAAYAECGRFPEAVETAAEAVERATTQEQSDWANDIGTRLSLYREGKAFRRPR